MKISIKGARVEKGMTQQQSGDAMGVTRETISNWERGITAPTAPQLMKLCELYGVNISDIFLIENLA
ncbi:MAG: helix-turn-helix transcriptional regulator [Lachnospiraceae bacterium]|nr:helix-turn-helix transcriptional regulator [Lachnospiraceae bacterium]